MINPKESGDYMKNANEHISVSTSLDDEQRVKVLSPGMLVFRRFIRNRLAIVGFFIILFMFYSHLWVDFSRRMMKLSFTHVGTMSKEYASITQNTELRYTVAEGKEYNDGAHAQFILAKNSGKKFFTYNGIEYSIIQEDEDLYIITQVTPVANVTYFRGLLV